MQQREILPPQGIDKVAPIPFACSTSEAADMTCCQSADTDACMHSLGFDFGRE